MVVKQMVHFRVHLFINQTEKYFVFKYFHGDAKQQKIIYHEINKHELFGHEKVELQYTLAL